MKKQLIFILLTILSFTTYAQITFEKGYYITNSGQKVECLIRNVDWKNNPTKFDYKTEENSEIKKATIETTKEFGIYNVSKYSRYTVQIDRSSEHLSELDENGEPIFKEEQLFLKSLVEGKATLFSYEDGSLRRYFYSVNDAIVKQLIFKKFLKPESLTIRKNNTYRSQLWNDLKCPEVSINNIKQLNYYKKDLTKFFINYNECNDSEYILFGKKKRSKNAFSLTIRPGLNSSSLTVKNPSRSASSRSRNVSFDNELGFRFGIEAEYVFPFNKNKWALILEPTYQYYKSENQITLDPDTVFQRTEIVKADYSSIELPIGIRHYFFLSDKSKIFINCSYTLDFSTKSTIEYETVPNLSGKTGTNLAFGLGYKQNNKYSIEIRYMTPRNLLGNYQIWESDYKTISVIMGYTIF